MFDRVNSGAFGEHRRNQSGKYATYDNKHDYTSVELELLETRMDHILIYHCFGFVTFVLVLCISKLKTRK